VNILLTHTVDAFANYYGDRALAQLARTGAVRRNPNPHVLTTAELVVQARDCAIIVADRQTAGEGALFDRLPELVAFVRVAVDIRNVDVAAASRTGVLVTRASPGFVTAL
jgi:D-3-phosphoglycerate dehydrogenase